MSKCTGCGADLQFDPKSQQLLCHSCGNALNVTDHAEILAQENKMDDILEYTCPQCGGSIYTTDSTAATFCSYCGSSVVLEHSTTDFHKPDGIIPFKISRKKAESIYLARIKKAWFAPTPLKQDNKLEKIRGIYMPYKILNYHADGPGELTSRKHYTKGDYVVQETRKDWGRVISDVRVVHDGLSEFSDVISQGVLPYKLDQKQAYNPAYFSGFYADKADIDEQQIHESRHEEANKAYRKSWTEKLKTGEFIADVHREPELALTNTETCLCPVWFISNQQPNGSVSYAAVNGQTGAVATEIPIDKKKFIGFSALFSVIAYIFLILFGVTFTPHMAIGITGVLAAIVGVLITIEARELYMHNCELAGLKQPRSTPASEILRYACKPAIAAFIALVVFIINPVQDVMQYASAAIVFLLTLWSCLDVVKLNNLVASRTPAQLKKRGGDGA